MNPKLKRGLIQLMSINGSLALLYFFFGLFSFQFAVTYKTISSAVFFPEGIALAYLILFGRKMLIGVALGQLLLALYNDVNIWVSLSITIGNTLEYYAAFIVFNYFKALRGKPSFKDFILVVFTVLLVCQPISVAFGVSSFLVFTNLSWNDAQTMAIYWYLGNATAQFLMAPAILIWRLVFIDKLPLRNIREFTVFLVLIIILLPQTYGIFETGIEISSIHIFSLIYPLLIFAASRYELPGVTFINVCIVIFAQLATVLNKGPFSDTSIADNLVQLNIFNIVTTISSILLALLFYEKRVLQENVTALAHTDPLTSLLNRRRFMELAKLYQKQQKRTHIQGAVLMIDIDYFKQINDRFGHDVGDKVLNKLGEILSNTLRDVDLKARYGGEEFIILLAPPVNIEVVADRLLEKIRSCQFKDHKGKNHSITVSMGIYRTQEDDDCVETIIRYADIALYQAKSKGRNRIEYYTKGLASRSETAKPDSRT